MTRSSPAPTPLAPDEVAGVLAPLERAIGLPARAYLDEGVLAFERQAIFGPSWTIACREADVEQPGSWALASARGGGAPGDDILVLRGDDLELRAFYNICRHRGTPLVSAPPSSSGEARGRSRARGGACIECPYHGWTYATTGALVDAPHLPRGAHGDAGRSALGLLPVRLALWQGFVLVTSDAATPALDAWMGETPPWLREVDLRHVVRARSTSYVVDANWKLLVANFQESHHFPRVHPALERLTPSSRATTHLRDGAWLGGIMDISAERATVSTSGSLGGRALIVGEDRSRHVFDAMLFPATLTSLQPDYLLLYRLVPVSVDRTRVVAEIFAHPTTRPDSLAEVFELWDVVNGEDRAICERQQRGVASPGYRPGPYTTVDEGVHAFEQLVALAHRSVHVRP